MIHMLIKTKLYTSHFSFPPSSSAQASNENWYPLLEAMEMIIAFTSDNNMCVTGQRRKEKSEKISLNRKPSLTFVDALKTPAEASTNHETSQ